MRSLTGHIPGYCLSFTYAGYEGCEPRFANITRYEASENDLDVYGVAHCITPLELGLLDGFEGCGSAYERIIAIFQPLQLTYSNTNDNNFDGIEVHVYTALPSHTAAPGLPSARYRQLLLNGALQHHLPPHYTDRLASSPCLDSTNVTMPSASSTLKHISHDELLAHIFNKLPSTSGANVWGSIGGLVFDISSDIQSRAMLRGISNAIDGTKFVLQLWANAYSDGIVADTPMTSNSVIDVHLLDRHRQGYVSSWVHHLMNRYDCIGTIL